MLRKWGCNVGADEEEEGVEAGVPGTTDASVEPSSIVRGDEGETASAANQTSNRQKLFHIQNHIVCYTFTDSLTLFT